MRPPKIALQRSTKELFLRLLLPARFRLTESHATLASGRNTFCRDWNSSSNWSFLCEIWNSSTWERCCVLWVVTHALFNEKFAGFFFVFSLSQFQITINSINQVALSACSWHSPSIFTCRQRQWFFNLRNSPEKKENCLSMGYWRMSRHLNVFQIDTGIGNGNKALNSKHSCK